MTAGTASLGQVCTLEETFRCLDASLIKSLLSLNSHLFWHFDGWIYVMSAIPISTRLRGLPELMISGTAILKGPRIFGGQTYNLVVFPYRFIVLF